MKTVRVCLVAVAAALCALVLSPGIARADTLTGSTGITWVVGTSTFAIDTIADGSSLACPGTSAICDGYSQSGIQLGSETFSIGTSSISYSVSNFPGIGNPYYGGTTNGFDFTGLTFASGEPLSGFTIASNDIGLTDTDITIGPSSIFINLAGSHVDGSFTIDLIPSSNPVATPEPSSLTLLGIGLLALVSLAGKRFAAGRFAVESAS
jgi:PEP-CTERM motif